MYVIGSIKAFILNVYPGLLPLKLPNATSKMNIKELMGLHKYVAYVVSEVPSMMPRVREVMTARFSKILFLESLYRSHILCTAVPNP